MTRSNFAICFYCIILASVSALALTNGYKKRISIVTGANGYVGKEVVSVLLSDAAEDDCDNEILCLVRPNRIETETDYWKRVQGSSTRATVKVLPYDMLDGGKTITEALNTAIQGNGSDTNICVYHIASVFGPSEDHIDTAKDNVKGTKDLVEALANFSRLDCCRLVFTSSMAAVRGSGQTPKNGEYYTYHDWNTQSKLEDGNWGSSYQWSKAESERIAWELAEESNIPMVTICPSFVFGPPTSGADGEGDVNLSSSFSITLFGQWVRGESPVQSRLFVDVRDVAKAHVLAGNRPEAIGQRIIVSTEARVPSQEMAEILGEVCKETGLSDPEKVSFDGDFKGGAIPIGTREVEAASRLKNILGLTLVPVQETIRDMGRSLLLAEESK
ncbi:unnamed protein product [Pseudo-nitzschia multistriata]|uniref:NAD-dependent epimerase/dehydratase domain-containing protein n=1 Tax=Pseudo-nitzschia multistriata TaxID=183589 RepID=A0A448Z0N7_9STRA|nr:unnamed protein product [Pseudo-nitzschia multistriata]